ncbi:MAG: DnaD domain protein [Clostridia bacterium]|nr:DnaD domain protein [Clostridia bacterium]
MYKVNPEAFNGVFVMPKRLADEFLILSSEKQLKVLLYLYSHAYETPSEEEVSSATGIKKEELPDIFSYWEDLGMLIKSDAQLFVTKNEVSNKRENISVPEEKEPKKERINLKPSKPTHEMIRKRIVESEEVRVLFSEAQQCLGKTIGMGDQASLLLLYDYYGLPIEIILAICEFARTHNKSHNMNYIYKMGVDWSEREIDTIERADAEFKKIEAVNGAWGEFCAVTGMKKSKPTSAQSKYLAIWIDEWKFPMNILSLAFEEMSKYKGGEINFQYMHKILSAWHLKNVKTPEDVQKLQADFADMQDKKYASKNKKDVYGSVKPKAKESDKKASYDIEAAMKKAKTTVPVFKKREKR